MPCSVLAYSQHTRSDTLLGVCSSFCCFEWCLVTGSCECGLLPPLCCICMSLVGVALCLFRDCWCWHALFALPVGCLVLVLACDGLLVPQSSLLGGGEGVGYTQR